MAVAAALLSVTLSGCASLDAQLKASAQDKGRASAGVNIGQWPDDCRVTEPHAPLIVNTEAISTVKRERAVLDRQNARTLRCAYYFDDLADHFAQ